MRLLDAHRQHLELAVDPVAEVVTLVNDLLVVEEGLDHLDGFFLDIAAGFERSAEALEFVGAIGRPESEYTASAGEDVDKGGVLDHPDRVVQWKGDHGSADTNAGGHAGEVAHVREHVRHDAVLVGEVMLRDPGCVVPQPVDELDFLGHACVNAPVRVGLLDVVRVRGEQDTKFHGTAFLRQECRLVMQGGKRRQ